MNSIEAPKNKIVNYGIKRNSIKSDRPKHSRTSSLLGCKKYIPSNRTQSEYDLEVLASTIEEDEENRLQEEVYIHNKENMKAEPKNNQRYYKRVSEAKKYLSNVRIG